jgi:hypothetical protein
VLRRESFGMQADVPFLPCAARLLASREAESLELLALRRRKKAGYLIMSAITFCELTTAI